MDEIKRPRSVDELLKLQEENNKYIFYLDSKDECRKNVTIRDMDKRNLCWKEIKHRIIDDWWDYIDIDWRMFHYKNVYYREIEYNMEIKI